MTVSQIAVPRRQISSSHMLDDEEMKVVGLAGARDIAIQKMNMWALSHRVVFAHPNDLRYRWTVQALATGFEFPDDELYGKFKDTAIRGDVDPMLIAKIDNKNWRTR